MITGDNPKTAEAISNQLGIDRFLAQVLPQQKADVIKKLQAEGKITMDFATARRLFTLICVLHIRG